MVYFSAILKKTGARNGTHIQQKISESAAASLPDHFWQEVAPSLSCLLIFVDLLVQYVNQ